MRTIFPSEAFDRKLIRFLKLHKEMFKDVLRTTRLLEHDIRASSLKTHKLHGKLAKSHACSINYHYRIVFSFDEKYIYLESIGSHDDVY